MPTALRFFFVFEALVLGGLAIAQHALGRLPGLGLGFAQLLAMLILAWVVWFAASIGIPMGTGLVVIASLALIGAAVLLHRHRPIELDPFTRRLLIWSEVIFAVTFVVAVFIGGYAPDV